MLADGTLVARACDLSPFFLRMLQADASALATVLQNLRQPYNQAEMLAQLQACTIENEQTLKHCLRKLRQRVLLRLIIRDLNGLANLNEVMETCTVLAEVAIDVALPLLDRWQQLRYGQPLNTGGKPQQLIVIGMGKLGGRELNVSSDIDLIFAYAEDGETNGIQRLSHHQYFSRLGQKLIAAISEITADGFVFRVDMRLRPDGDAGPLVSSFAALEEYYQLHGREWERYAWIKGRTLSGHAEDRAELEQMLRPFVFRKYLDFGAIASMRELKIQIQREVIRHEMHNNIKLGRGGIREIEFIAQVFQLIRGGQQRQLQIRATMSTLHLLETKGYLPPEAVAELQAAYVFLRNLEHRLQYLQDAQTQQLPEEADHQRRIANGMGYDGWADFMNVLEAHRKHVEQHFNAVFENCSMSSAEHPYRLLWANIEEHQGTTGLLAQLEAMGFSPPEQALNGLRSMHRSAKYQLLSGQGRQRFDALLPTLIATAATCNHPCNALCRMLDVLEVIGRRTNYLALLAEFPQALDMVCKLCDASPWLAQYLAKHPIVLDELLDARTLHAAPDFAMLRVDLEQRLQACDGDVEAMLDTLRHFKHAHTFRFAAQDVTGGLELQTLSDYLSVLADIVLDSVLRHAWAGLRGRHRDTPQFAIIAYGKLGGRELGYASDLDLVFLYDDAAVEASDIYARFGQRINHWLSALTPAGMLYETDLCLRPDGASGLLVSNVQAFADYQQHKAWVWEHQAMTRARFCAGNATVGAAFESIRLDVVCRLRDIRQLCRDVIAMRQKMQDSHPNPSELFDIKHDRGGIIDIEFMVQMLVLAYANQYPALAENVGNIALLHRAGALGLVPRKLADNVADAYRVFRQHQHRLRLQGERHVRMPRPALSTQIEQVLSLWTSLTTACDQA